MELLYPGVVSGGEAPAVPGAGWSNLHSKSVLRGVDSSHSSTLHLRIGSRRERESTSLVPHQCSDK